MTSVTQVEQVFNNRTPSLPNGKLAYVARHDVVDSVCEAVRRRHGLTVVVGRVGVGKTSVVRHAVDDALMYRSHVGFRNVLYLSYADFSDGLSAAIGAAVGRARDERGEPLRPGVEHPIAELAKWLDEAQAVVVVENAQRLEGAVLNKIHALAKHLQDFHDRFKRTKLVLVAAASEASLRDRLGAALRTSLDFVEVPPWSHQDLEGIVLDGGRKSEVCVAPEVAGGIAAYSLGIPAATHLLAAKVLETARESRSRAMSTAHFETVLQNSAHLDTLSRNLLADAVDYVRQWRLRSDPLIPAVLALAGKAGRALSENEFAAALRGLATPAEISAALQDAAEVPLAIDKVAEDTWEARELVISVTALFELTARACRRGEESSRATRLLDAVLDPREQAPTSSAAQPASGSHRTWLGNGHHPPPSRAAQGSSPPCIFIGYCRQDDEYKRNLESQLKSLGDRLSVWSDADIDAGDDWFERIESAIARASCAVLVVSVNLLNSKFVVTEEVPRLLRRRLDDGMRLIPVIAKPCTWRNVPWLQTIQARPSGDKALSELTRPKRDKQLARIAEEVLELCGSPVTRSH